MTPAHRKTPPLVALAVLTAMTWSPVQTAPHAHEHGAMKIDITVENHQVTVQVEAPLDNLVGFERVPRNDPERRAAAEALARMRDGGALFKVDEAAQCVLQASTVSAPLLEPGARPAGKGEHGDLAAAYEFRCAQAQQLRTLEIGLFKVFPRTQRIDVEVAGLKGQLKTTLKRPANTVKLVR